MSDVSRAETNKATSHRSIKRVDIPSLVLFQFFDSFTRREREREREREFVSSKQESGNLSTQVSKTRPLSVFVRVSMNPT